MTDPNEILRFWFVEHGPADWFSSSTSLDRAIGDRFSQTVQQAIAGDLNDWTRTARGCLALCLVQDQFTRNLFRNTPQAFAGDERALATAVHALACGYDRDPGFSMWHRAFLYLPFEHSEDPIHQATSVYLFCKRVGEEQTIQYAVRHKEIIDLFGRFPHRNAILGRETTAEEADFLLQPNSSF